CIGILVNIVNFDRIIKKKKKQLPHAAPPAATAMMGFTCCYDPICLRLRKPTPMLIFHLSKRGSERPS
ncbi:MAG: hypothetical protein WAO07_20135, partial [Desulfobacterales bacterium]